MHRVEVARVHDDDLPAGGSWSTASGRAVSGRRGCTSTGGSGRFDDVVLLVGARDVEHDNAVVLREHLRAIG